MLGTRYTLHLDEKDRPVTRLVVAASPANSWVEVQVGQHDFTVFGSVEKLRSIFRVSEEKPNSSFTCTVSLETLESWMDKLRHVAPETELESTALDQVLVEMELVKGGEVL